MARLFFFLTGSSDSTELENWGKTPFYFFYKILFPMPEKNKPVGSDILFDF